MALTKTLEPAVTPQAVADRELQPFIKYGGPTGDGDVFRVFNRNWPFLYHLPDSVKTHLPIPDWTMFQVTIGYRDGVVHWINVVEMQQHRTEEISADSTHLYLSRYEADRFLPHGVTGYDDEPNYKVTFLDETASGRQRAQALNFQLECMTSFRPCDTPQKIRPTVQ